MTLFFVNGSKQKKVILESEYADDLYDAMIGFFEEHGRFPHFLKVHEEEDDLKITFESLCEFFLLTGADKEQKEEFIECMNLDL